MRQQEFNSSVYGDIAGRDIVKNTTVQIAQQTVVHHHHSAPPAQLAQAAPPMTLAQKKLLSLMKPMPKAQRLQALEFMRAQFGTAMVRELPPPSLAITHLYVARLLKGNNK